MSEARGAHGGEPSLGISLRELSEAYAQAMGEGRPADRREGEDRPERAGEVDDAAPLRQGLVEPASVEPDQEDPCPVCPRTILEAMLFVGNVENRPLAPQRAAELMRGVRADEIPRLVAELNRRYAANGCPYEILSESGGYRMVLVGRYHHVREKFYGRVRQTRLSQAAIEVLAIVAYRQPLTAEGVSKLRDKPSSHVLAQLVRRRLLRIERPQTKSRTAYYHTTDRFLALFGLNSLEDLPRSEEP